MHHYLALDFGAESGRVMLGTLDGGLLRLEEVHRFPTGSLAISGTLRWDVLRFYDEVRTGLLKVAKRAWPSRGSAPIRGASTTSW